MSLNAKQDCTPHPRECQYCCSAAIDPGSQARYNRVGSILREEVPTPIYEYRAAKGENGCPHCADGFEVRQSLSAPRLKTCSECGCAVAKVLSPVGINTALSSVRANLSDSNLKKHGFTKLVNEGGGRFRKT